MHSILSHPEIPNSIEYEVFAGKKKKKNRIAFPFIVPVSCKKSC